MRTAFFDKRHGGGKNRMKIYVAGKWEEKDRVREVQQKLQLHGHTITHDWTTEESCGDNEDKWKSHAVNDLAGVLNADAYVGVFEKNLKYSGAIAEFGIALGNGIPIYIIGHALDTNVFMRLPQVNRGIDELCN